TAAALDASGRRGGRLLSHRGDAPRPGVIQPAADPAAALNDRGTPIMKGAIDVQPRVAVLGSRGAAQHRHHLRARGNLPEGDDPPLERDACLAQDLATALVSLMRMRVADVDRGWGARTGGTGRFWGTDGRGRD